METREQTIERLEVKGFEIVTDLRDSARRIKMIDGVDCYFSAAEETARDSEEQVWIDDSDNRKWEEIRTRRNALLAETDHYALQDRELSEEMEAYREQLRQVPQNTADPLKFDMESGWPTKP